MTKQPCKTAVRIFCLSLIIGFVVNAVVTVLAGIIGRRSIIRLRGIFRERDGHGLLHDRLLQDDGLHKRLRRKLRLHVLLHRLRNVLRGLRRGRSYNNGLRRGGSSSS